MNTGKEEYRNADVNGVLINIEPYLRLVLLFHPFLTMTRTFVPPSSLAWPNLTVPRLAMGNSNSNAPVRMTSIRSTNGSIKKRDCIICIESKQIYRNFPSFSPCNHEANTCINCYIKQATVVVKKHRRWEALTCPACNITLPKAELEAAIPRSNSAAQNELKRLDDLVAKHALTQNSKWRWCLAPDCGHGQVYYLSQIRSKSSPKIACPNCGARSCFKHQVKWHEGYTCDEYDARHPDSFITKTNEETIKSTTKACPKCAWRIQKEGGCNHMVCEYALKPEKSVFTDRHS